MRDLVAAYLHRLAAIPDDPAIRALTRRTRAELVEHVLAQCAAQRRLLEDLGVTMLAPPATLEEIDALAKQLDALASGTIASEKE